MRSFKQDSRFVPGSADLWSLFGKAKSSKNYQAEVTGYALPGRKRDYLGKGASGEPIFLISISSTSRDAVPVRLRHFVSEQVRCDVKEATGKKQTGDFIRLVCKTDDVS